MDNGTCSPQAPEYASFSLGEWTGLTLMRGACAGTPAAPPIEWKWLERLVSDRGTLPGLRILKTSETVDIFEVRLPRGLDQDPLRVICKQTNTRGVKDGLAGLVRPSAARRNFERAKALQSARIGTALPLAYLERKSPRASWLITEYLEGVVDLDAYVLTVLSRSSTAIRQDRRVAIISALVGLCRGLERAGLYHRDLKASNILLANVQLDPPRVFIVDLDGLNPTRPWRSAWKPMTRLAASLLQYSGVSSADYARFLREYLVADGQSSRAWRSHFHRLRKQAARYSQAAQNRKTKKLDGYAGDS